MGCVATQQTVLESQVNNHLCSELKVVNKNLKYSRQHLCKPPCRYARRPKFLNPRSNKQTNKSANVQNFSLNVQLQTTNLQVINSVYVVLTGPKSIPSHCKIGQGAHDILKAFYLISLPAPTFFFIRNIVARLFL